MAHLTNSEEVRTILKCYSEDKLSRKETMTLFGEHLNEAYSYPFNNTPRRTPTTR